MNACAFVVGPRNGPAAAIHDLATRVGFETVLPYAGVADAERQARQTPLCFFLFAEVPRLRQLAGPTQAIRVSASDSIRFSPLIYLCRRAPVEMIRGLIDMGFDDVITEPFDQQRVMPRLARQIDQHLFYFETPNYFGPDRRSGENRGHGVDQTGQHDFRRIEIVRHFTTGVDVLSNDMQFVV